MPTIVSSLRAGLCGLTLVLGLPTAALAYYPCDGAGPGEVIIGMEPNGPGMPETPLCEYVGDDGGGGSDPGGYWVERFGAIAWALDQNGSATYSYYINASSADEADNGAMAQCAASGFSGCQLGPSVANGSLAIAVDANGNLHADWGSDARQAGKKALKICRKAGGKGCKVEQTLDNPSVWYSY